jgi:large subunit ribosomal protein L23
MSRLFRRALSTTIPTYAGPSAAPTLPLAVRRRREEHPATYTPSALVEPEKFVGENAEPFPVKMEEEFQALRARGALVGEEDEARRKFLAAAKQWRSRVRGGTGVIDKATGETRPDSKMAFIAREGAERTYSEDVIPAIVGQKIYLPNLQIRLMRNHTAPGEAYDPWTATFRIPPSVTKNDLRSYLSAAYGLDVTFIRTDNYIAPLTRTTGGKVKIAGGSRKNYKRAVVGLKEPFHYPDDVEEMRAGTWGGIVEGAKQAEAREELIEGEYAIQQVKEYRDALKLKMNKRAWRWRSGTHDNAVSSVVWAVGNDCERGVDKRREMKSGDGRRREIDRKRLSQLCLPVHSHQLTHHQSVPSPANPPTNPHLHPLTHRATPSARSCAAARSARPRSPPRPRPLARSTPPPRLPRPKLRASESESLRDGDDTEILGCWGGRAVEQG